MNKIDPRPLHFLFMGGMFMGASLYYDFSVNISQVIIIFCSCIIAQLILNKLFNNDLWKIHYYYSVLITATGISVLLRSNNYLIFIAISFAAILSKYLIRYKRKHVFNPANFGIILAIFLFPAWVSPGQWGVGGNIVFSIALIGMMLIYRAKVLTMTLSFLASYALLLWCYKVLWIGNSIESYMNGIFNGSFIIFAFFMISDPKTSPNSSVAKIIHSSLISLLAITLSEIYYINNSLIWALFFGNIVVPIWDIVFTGEQYQWQIKRDLVNNNLVELSESSTLVYSVQ